MNQILTKEEAIKSIRKNLPKTVYKFRDWNDEYHRRVLTTREVFFASPNTLNDPSDFNNPIRYDLLDKDELLARIKQNLRSTHKKWNDKAIENWAKVISEKKHLNASYLSEMGKDLLASARRVAGVFSTSKEKNELQLWAYYANSHKGFCVGFDTVKLWLDTRAAIGEVGYKPMDQIRPSLTDANEDYIHQSNIKSLQWAHEKEIRFTKLPVQDKDRAIQIRPETIIEVNIGLYTPKENEYEILEELSKPCYSHVKIYKAQLNPGDQNLSFKKVNGVNS